MTINSMNTNSMLNSFLSTNNSKKSPSVFGFDYASANMLKLEKIVANRTKSEENFSQKLNDFRNTSKDFYKDFYPKMSDLSSAASKLKVTSMDSTLRPTGYSSDNGAVVTAVSGAIDSGKSLDVKVSQIATGQKNTYSDVSATAKGDLAGKSSLEISVGGKKVEVTVEIDEKVSNEQALRQIVDKVNAAKTGVTASIEVKNGRAQISLFDDTTGEKSKFTTKITGKAAGVLGEGTSIAGVNAKYSVDGKDLTSETNKIQLADGKISATIAGVGNANIGKKNFDTSNAVSAMKDFATKYNSALDFLNKNSSVSTSVKTLASSFGNTKYIADALNTVGVSTDSVGRLSVDEKKFSEALKTDADRINKIVGSAGGLAGSTYSKVSEAVVKSSSFIQPPRNYNGFYGTSIGMMMDFKA